MSSALTSTPRDYWSSSSSEVNDDYSFSELHEFISDDGAEHPGASTFVAESQATHRSDDSEDVFHANCEQPTPCVTPDHDPDLTEARLRPALHIAGTLTIPSAGDLSSDIIRSTTPHDPFRPDAEHIITVNREDIHDAFTLFFAWIRQHHDRPLPNFTIVFENENACGNGIHREFFRLLWDGPVLPHFFGDNEVSGLPLPSTRMLCYHDMQTLGKFIALSIRHDYLPLQIHPLCYIDPAIVNMDGFSWRKLVYLYDPIQADAFPTTFQQFIDLPVEQHEYLNDRYHFWTDVCCFTEVTQLNFPVVREEFFKRIILPFPMQRTLARVRQGYTSIRNFQDVLHRGDLAMHDKDLFARFETATNLTAAMLLERTTFDFQVDKATQRTYAVYRRVLESMTPQDLKRWLLFVTNSTVPNQQMRVSVGNKFFVRTCFFTVQLGRQYTTTEELRADLQLVMTQGMNQAMVD